MTDDLDDIKAMMTAATPAPDPTRRAENLALAQKNFDSLQETRPAARPTNIWARTARFVGGLSMNTFSTRGGLAATTALVACGVAFMTPLGQDLIRTPLPIDVSFDDATQKAIEAAPQNFTTAEITEDAPRAQELAPVLMEAPIVIMDSEVPEARGRVMAPAAEAGEGGLAATVVEAPVVVFNDALPAPSAGLRTAMGQAPAPDVVIVQPQPDTEAFPEADTNPLKVTTESPVSTFSIDVDTASYAVVRSSLMNGQLPPADAVRIEEMINYFPYDYPAPDTDGHPFRPTVSTMTTPWNPDTQLVHIALQGQMPAVEARPPLNLVFLIDTSGSMGQPNKLPLLRQSLLLMLDQLRPEDEVAIVTYAGSAGQVLPPTPAREKGLIQAALTRLDAGGSTNGIGGLEQAYQVAEAMAADGQISRVLLATDGDFNVGIHDPDALKDYIADKRDTGTYLSVLGFGRGNLDDATMQALAQNGNGTAAYIDTLNEAQKVLVDQLTGALFTIAGDVKVQVEWNPAAIAEYRLIGYETRALRREDFNNDAVDAGELGAGHAVTALYEVTPVGSPARLTDPLRYAADEPDQAGPDGAELGYVKLRYKAPGDDTSQLLEAPIQPSGAGTEARFAAAIAGFGQLLKDDSYLGDWTYEDAIALAGENRGTDPFGYRTEALQLMRLASSLSR